MMIGSLMTLKKLDSKNVYRKMQGQWMTNVGNNCNCNLQTWRNLRVFSPATDRQRKPIKCPMKHIRQTRKRHMCWVPSNTAPKLSSHSDQNRQPPLRFSLVYPEGLGLYFGRWTNFQRHYINQILLGAEAMEIYKKQNSFKSIQSAMNAYLAPLKDFPEDTRQDRF